MKKLGKPTSEWTDPKTGLRCVQVEGSDEIFNPVEDLVKLICTFDVATIDEPFRREAVTRFQREAPLLQPAAAHRRAIEMLKAFGAGIDPDMERLPLKKVEGGK